MRGLGIANNINDFLLQLYALARDAPMAEFQDRSLKLLKTVLPFDSSMWGTATAQHSGIDIHTIHLHDSDPQMLADYEQLKHEDIAAATVLGKPHVTSSFNSDEWFGARDQRHFREFLTRYGHEHIFITAASNPVTKFVHWVSLYRADANAQCRCEEKTLLGQLAPHIMQALNMNRIMQLATELDPGAPARVGMAIADLRGVIYHADALFDTHAALEWHRWTGAAIPDTVRAALRTPTGSMRGERTVLAWRVEQRLLFLKLRPLCKADALSERERMVARLIADGKTHKEVARELARSPSTVRNQIQSIYAKLEVGNVVQLTEQLRHAGER